MNGFRRSFNALETRIFWSKVAAHERSHATFQNFRHLPLSHSVSHEPGVASFVNRNMCSLITALNCLKFLFQNLIPIIVQMATSKYAHFCVSRMVKYGTPDIKQKIIEAMYGNVVKMINHQHSSAILDNLYISWANSQQKSSLRQEFYGDLYKKVSPLPLSCQPKIFFLKFSHFSSSRKTVL